MKLIRYIKDVIYVTRVLNSKNILKKLIDKNINIDIVLEITKLRYKNKDSYIRNSTALIVRKIRKEKPYKIQDYSKARQFYENQPKGIDFSKVKEGSYVVKFTEEYAVKGKRWCEYYINFTSGTGVFKVGKWDDKWGYFRLEDYKGYDGTYSLDIEDSIVFRFATKEEIEEFKNRRKEYKAKRKEINKLQEQITKLYKEL